MKVEHGFRNSFDSASSERTNPTEKEKVVTRIPRLPGASRVAAPFRF